MDNATESVITLYYACMENALCRNLYGEQHGETSLERFMRMLGGERGIAWIDSILEDSSQTIAYILSAKQGLLVDNKCAPNEFAYWDHERETMGCVCYMDRDCSARSVPLCYADYHPILIASFAAVVVAILFFIANANFFGSPNRRDARKQN